MLHCMKRYNRHFAWRTKPKVVCHIIASDSRNDLILFILLAIPHRISLGQGREPGSSGVLASQEVFMQLKNFKLGTRYFCNETLKYDQVPLKQIIRKTLPSSRSLYSSITLYFRNAVSSNEVGIELR